VATCSLHTANQGDSHFAHSVAPGEHHLCVDWQLNRRFVRDHPKFDLFTAEAGKVYYFQVRVAWTPHVDASGRVGPGGDMDMALYPVNEDQGKYMVFSSKLSTFIWKK
jgi:hypothetical protein